MSSDDFRDWYGFSPYSYEFVQGLGENAIPRELQEQTYNEWKKKPGKDTMHNIVKAFTKLINSEIGRYKGTLERPTLQSYAKKYVIDAIKSFQPNKGNQLSTHLVHNLQRLHRLNYKNVQGLHTSEELQRNMNNFLTSRNNLTEELGREPNYNEIAARMGSPVKLVKKLDTDLKYEVPSSSVTYEPVQTETTEDQLVMDYLYHDLNDQQKFIFQHKTGYNGSPILMNKDIAKKLKVSPVRVTQISEQLSNKFQEAMGGVQTK